QSVVRAHRRMTTPSWAAALQEGEAVPEHRPAFATGAPVRLSRWGFRQVVRKDETETEKIVAFKTVPALVPRAPADPRAEKERLTIGVGVRRERTRGAGRVAR